MYQINFLFDEKNVEPVTLTNIAPNQSLLEIAMDNNIDIHHNCGGVCACTTCHIYLVEGEKFLSEITDREEDYIDRAANPTLQSRLSCQAMLLKNSGSITIKVPDQSQFLGE